MKPEKIYIKPYDFPMGQEPAEIFEDEQGTYYLRKPKRCLRELFQNNEFQRLQIKFLTMGFTYGRATNSAANVVEGNSTEQEEYDQFLKHQEMKENKNEQNKESVDWP